MAWIIEDKELHNMATETYSLIKDNQNIPIDIRESWRDMCVKCVDIKELCN